MQLNYIFMLFLGWKVFFHPFYISLTEIRYNPENQSLEIAQKIFWDDLEVALTKIYETKVDFLNPSNSDALEEMVKSYILEKNEIMVNGQKLNLDYLGFEIEEEAVWFYMEALKVPSPNNVQIRNEVLIEHFEGQQNIVNFYKEQKPKSLILYKGKEMGTLNF
ncbi:hypothetical protein SAMN00777080_1175 [Aquiflexum balticum DSM 16537]|uniref:Uncharacterized protein n=1 Tax=Aquiflexum balticum DSM 16537 TaxID=758820 RepID=A0A1W2H1I3_9BACT|nr:DUF6702 family protein [Aquiflexum balticum]SMD42614.1 hypothetical protein SAMN00777080_1175 [Aquiflexum balticum DSM 16537]